MKKEGESYLSGSEKETMALAAAIASVPGQTGIICLSGGLGSGKTVFAKGFASALGINEKKIKSPTYTFVREYKLGKKRLYHFDFYRIESADDLMAENLREIFDDRNAIILIEWPERIAELLPKKKIGIGFEYIDEKTRRITVSNE
jgi:tRNA threonylcarbamoyladenosine biosynthesis protein TsaE